MGKIDNNSGIWESNNYLKSSKSLELYNQIDSPLFIVNGKGKVLFSNSSCIDFLQLFNYPKDFSIFSIFCEHDEKKFERALNKTKINGSSKIENLHLLIPSQSETKIGLYIQELQHGTDQYVCTFQNKVIASNRKIDISQLFLNISSNLQEGIFRISLETGLVFINNYFLKIFEVESRRELIEKDVQLFLVDISQKEFLIKKLLKERLLKNESVRLLRPNGSVFWARINCSLIYDRQSGCYVDGTLNDITQHKESEKLLKEKNTELKKINIQLDKFIYSASHDIRSPMTSIMGLVNILRMEIDESKHLFLDKIDTSLHKLDYFIKETLQFSENTKKRILSHKINFKTLVELAWDKVNGPNSHVTLELNVQGSDYIFFSDFDRLLIIFKNIFRNSIQFSDSSKKMKYIDVYIKTGMMETEIVISDNGIGIGKSYVQNVFDMFYRAHEYLAGPGMGLYIVKETLLKLNGTIDIKSELREGTILTIKLPNDKKGVLMWKKRTLES